jgi:hypothetical protein
MATTKNQAALVQRIVSLWKDYSNGPGEYERLLWNTGALVGPMVERESSTAAADQCLHELATLLAKPLGVALNLPQLVNCLLIQRAFPDGPPPLSWGHLCFLARIKDARTRTLYARETCYRGWSDLQLHRSIEAASFSEFRAPDPNWRLAASGDVLALAQTPRGLAIVRASGDAPQQQSGESSVDQEGNQSVRVSEVDWRTGIESDLGRAWCNLYTVELGWAGGKLYRTTVDGLQRRDRSRWRLVLPGDGWALAQAPLDVAGTVVTVWSNQDMFDAKFRIAVLEGETVRWSEVFEGGASRIVACGSSIVVRVRSRAERSESWRLQRIELSDLRQVASATVNGWGVLVAQGGQLLAGSRLWCRSAEDVGRDISQPGSPRDDEIHISRVVHVGEVGLHVVACFDSNSLAPVRQWIVAEEPVALQVLPDGRGLVVTEEHKIQAIVPGRARPVLLCEWNGTVIGAPIRLGTRLAWLVLRQSPSNPYRRTATAAGSGEKDFVIEIFDFTSGAWSFLPFDASQPVSSMHLCGDAILFIGARGALAFNAIHLLDAAVQDGERPRIALKPGPKTSGAITGLALSGPLDQQWAAEVAPELARELFSPRELAAWLAASDANERFRLWQRRVDQVLAQVRSWPDFLGWAAPGCAGEFLALTEAIEGESQSSPPFGSTAIPWSAIEPVLAWKRSIESSPMATVDSDDALRSARTLLYEYAMRCASTRSLDPIRNLGSKGVAVINGLEGSALDSFAWLNLAPVGRRRIDLNALQRLWAKWPDGCPPLIEDAEAFVKFAQDCVLAGLLDRRGRTELQAAVAKAWEQPAVNRKQMVFVSYSHQQADLAQRLADGLRDLGVGAVLDSYELDRDASGAVLETWIAESLMRSVTTVYLLSEDVRLSGWVHRESEWQMRLLGIKPSLVLPYIVSFDHSDSSARYPRSRTIYGNALVKQPTKTIKQLAGRLTIDWLLTLKARKLDQNFGIAYQGKQIVEIVAKPESSSLGSDGS